MIYLKMKIACIKFAGLGSGGTEKYLQTLACILKTKYDVDYYYTNNAPRIGTDWKHPENSEERKKVVESYGIRTIPIHVDAYDELLFRLPFDRVVDHLTTGSLSGDQPLQSALTASFTSWSPDVTYDFIDISISFCMILKVGLLLLFCVSVKESIFFIII